MGHGHHHGHNHAHHANKKALFFGFLLTFAYMIAETVGGWLTHSLALLSDAGHMLSDAVSLAVGLAAFKLGERAANGEKTYGYKRFEILAALFNGVALLVITAWILFEAYHRFFKPVGVESTGMMIVAVLGLIVNGLVAYILMKGDTSENLNVRAAFLHVIGDLFGSVGAIAAALLIWGFGWNWADPLMSVIVAVLILVSALRVIKESVNVLMEGVPRGIDVEAIVRFMRSQPGVIDIHDLHVWSITSGKNALSCHVVLDRSVDWPETQKLLGRMEHELAHMGIGHVTIQFEDGSLPHKPELFCDLDDEGEGRHGHHHHIHALE